LWRLLFGKLSGGKNFLADKIDLHFIEGHIWYSINSQNYVGCRQNKRCIMFYNLILNHTPTNNATVDHINQNPLDNRRINLRVATRQIQAINQTQRRGLNHSGVNFYKNHFVATWINKHGVQKTARFNIHKLGYEIAKQLAIDKRLEIELSLNHYLLALHGLPPLEPQEDSDAN